MTLTGMFVSENPNSLPGCGLQCFQIIMVKSFSFFKGGLMLPWNRSRMDYQKKKKFSAGIWSCPLVADLNRGRFEYEHAFGYKKNVVGFKWIKCLENKELVRIKKWKLHELILHNTISNFNLENRVNYGWPIWSKMLTFITIFSYH